MEVRRLYRLYTFPMIQFLGDHSRAYFKYRRQHYQSSSGANASPRLSFKANSLKNNLLIRFVVIILLVAARFAPRRFFGRREFKFSRLSEVPEIRGGERHHRRDLPSGISPFGIRGNDAIRASACTPRLCVRSMVHPNCISKKSSLPTKSSATLSTSQVVVAAFTNNEGEYFNLIVR
jgi:hypothetical protein